MRHWLDGQGAVAACMQQEHAHGAPMGPRGSCAWPAVTHYGAECISIKHFQDHAQRLATITSNYIACVSLLTVFQRATPGSVFDDQGIPETSVKKPELVVEGCVAQTKQVRLTRGVEQLQVSGV